VRFIVDAQLPPILAAWLAGRGEVADHVLDLGLIDEPDQIIWDTALAAGAVVVTKDRDFVEWATARRPAPQILWLRIGNATNRSLTARLDVAWEQILSDLASGAQVVEVGRQ